MNFSNSSSCMIWKLYVLISKGCTKEKYFGEEKGAIILLKLPCSSTAPQHWECQIEFCSCQKRYLLEFSHSEIASDEFWRNRLCLGHQQAQQHPIPKLLCIIKSKSISFSLEWHNCNYYKLIRNNERITSWTHSKAEIIAWMLPVHSTLRSTPPLVISAITCLLCFICMNIIHQSK